MKLSLFITLCLAGCASQPSYYVRSFTTPAGHPGIVVECQHEPDCWSVVSQSCPNGYTILDNKSLRSDTVANGQQGIHPSQNGVVAAECKPQVVYQSAPEIVHQSPYGNIDDPFVGGVRK